MARVEYSGLINDLRGSIGGWTYSIWKAGVAYVRKQAAIISNPASADQANVRCKLAYYAKYWYDLLTAQQRIDWSTWALTEPGKGNKDGGILTLIKGNNGKMSGFNAFVMAMQWLYSAGHGMSIEAPLGATPPTPPKDVSLAWVSPTLTVNWVAPDIYMPAPEARARIWIAHHKGLFHRQLAVHELVTQLTKNITQVKGANGDLVSLSDCPGEIIVQMDTVDPNGTKSGPSNVVQTVLT